MGRILSAGIATKIYVKGDGDENKLGEIFDLRNFNVSKEVIKGEEYLVYEIKKDFFEDNIHNFIKEFKNIGCLYLADDIMDNYNEEFNQKSCQIELKDELIYINGYDVSYNLDKAYNDELGLLYYGRDEICYNIEYYIFAFSGGKIGCEAEDEVITLLNIFVRKYFENPLGKYVIFNGYG